MPVWSPDVCPGFEQGKGCKIELVPGAWAVKSILQKCSAHSVDPFNEAWEECRRKEELRARVLSVLTLDKVQARRPDVTAEKYNAFMEALFTWSFGAGRRLNLFLSLLTVAEKTALQTWCDTRFGAGKVAMVVL